MYKLGDQFVVDYENAKALEKNMKKYKEKYFI